MNITIVGGGNVGTQFAVHCAAKGHKVTMFTSKPQLFSKRLCIVGENNETVMEAELFRITDEARVAYQDAEVVFVTVPSNCMERVAFEMLPHLKKRAKVGLVPGAGGGECYFVNHIENDGIVFGLQRVPAVARLVQYGHCVRAIGYRSELHVASLPYREVDECRRLVEDIFDIPCVALPNYLNITLTPSNPILHTTRLRVIFKEYAPGKVYECLPLFYEDWDNESSELLLKCDKEVQDICHSISEIDLRYVRSLSVHYENDTPEGLTKKISGIAGFKGITTPGVKVEGGYLPDFQSRYFLADFLYGMNIIIQIGKLANVTIKSIEETYRWFLELGPNEKAFCYSDWGIDTYKKFLAFYLT